jgi:hypothetical protein
MPAPRASANRMRAQGEKEGPVLARPASQSADMHGDHFCGDITPMLPEPVLDFIFLAMPFLPLLYLALQVGAILKMRGGLRIAASLCGLVMLGLVVFVAWASGVMGSNIAPIYIVFALPLLTAILILLWLIHALRPAPPDTRYL